MGTTGAFDKQPNNSTETLSTFFIIPALNILETAYMWVRLASTLYVHWKLIITKERIEFLYLIYKL